MHRRRRTADEIRARIVDVAEQMATERPFAEIPTREIARRAGVQQSVIYRYFPSKSALAIEMMRRAATKLADDLQSTTDPLTALRLTSQHLQEHRELLQLASAGFGASTETATEPPVDDVDPVEPDEDRATDDPLRPGDQNVWTIIDRIAKHRGVDADDPDVRIDWILAGTLINGSALMGDYLTAMDAAHGLGPDEIAARFEELLACIVDGSYRRS